MQDKSTQIYYNYETSNKSFRDAVTHLEERGSEGAKEILGLYNKHLLFVDPFDPDISREDANAVYEECKKNPWYFYREIVRIPRCGDYINILDPKRPYIGTTYGTNFDLTMASAIQLKSYHDGLNTYQSRCRQAGVEMTALLFVVYQFLFGEKKNVSYIDRHMRAKNESAADRMTRIEQILSLIPEYLLSGVQYVSKHRFSDMLRLSKPNSLEVSGLTMELFNVKNEARIQIAPGYHVLAQMAVSKIEKNKKFYYGYDIDYLQSKISFENFAFAIDQMLRNGSYQLLLTCTGVTKEEGKIDIFKVQRMEFVSSDEESKLFDNEIKTKKKILGFSHPYDELWDLPDYDLEIQKKQLCYNEDAIERELFLRRPTKK